MLVRWIVKEKNSHGTRYPQIVLLAGLLWLVFGLVRERLTNSGRLDGVLWAAAPERTYRSKTILVVSKKNLLETHEERVSGRPPDN